MGWVCLLGWFVLSAILGSTELLYGSSHGGFLGVMRVGSVLAWLFLLRRDGDT